MKKVLGICGAGAMGIGIAQIAALHGWEVRIYDVSESGLENGQKKLHSTFGMLVNKGKITPSESVAALGQLYFSDQLNILSDCQLVIEAIVEKIEIKKALFSKLSDLLSKSAIVATNTSSLSVTELSCSYAFPDQFLGIHFFNPVPLMPLVEVIPTSFTSDECRKEVDQVLEDWGKVVVEAKDSPGFIVNKVARPFYSEALRIAEEGLALPEEIDQAMEDRGFRMGPFRLMDFIGHDVNYSVTESVWTSFYYDARYRPSHLQLDLVRAGKLGRKSGQGFYSWDGKKCLRPAVETGKKLDWIFERIFAMLVNEAADTVYHNICNSVDVDLAMTKGVNYPQGLLQWSEIYGIEKIISLLDLLFDFYHDARYRVSPYLRQKIKA